MAKKGQPKRTMRLHKMDGSFIDLEITKATSVGRNGNWATTAICPGT
jgi:hypothetical protein